MAANNYRQRHITPFIQSTRHFLPLDWEAGMLTWYTAKDHK